MPEARSRRRRRARCARRRRACRATAAAASAVSTAVGDHDAVTSTSDGDRAGSARRLVERRPGRRATTSRARTARSTTTPTTTSISAPSARRKNADRLHVEGDGLAGEHLVLVDRRSAASARRSLTGMGTVKQMDLDALSAARREEWERLDELSRTRRLERRRGRRAHRRATARHPPISPTSRPRPAHAAGRPRLDDARARAAAVHRRARERRCGRSRGSSRCSCRPRSTGVRWMTLVDRRRVRRGRRARRAAGSRATPRCVATLGSRGAARAATPRTSFIDYYSENPAAVFAGQVWTNNAWIAAQCVLFGITGRLAAHGARAERRRASAPRRRSCRVRRGRRLLPLHPPHGLLELTCDLRRRRGRPAHLLGVGRARARARAARRSPRTGARSSRSSIGLVIALACLGHHRGLRHRASPGRGRSRSASARSRSPRSWSTWSSSAGGRTGAARPAT